MLEEFEREVEHTDSRLRSLTSRVNKAIRKSGGECIVVLYLYCITSSQMEFMHVCDSKALVYNYNLTMLNSGNHSSVVYLTNELITTPF